MRAKIGVLALVFAAAVMFGVPRTSPAQQHSRGLERLKHPFLLVATDKVGDPFFYHSVVLMLPVGQYPLQVGLIINKPTTVALSTLFPDSPGLKDRADRAFFGGPVDVNEPSLVYRATQPQGEAIKLFEGVYLAADPHVIGELLKNSAPKQPMRLFLGRAQWGPGQLIHEAAEGSWYALEADPDLIFTSAPQSLWETLVAKAQAEQVKLSPTLEPTRQARLHEVVSHVHNRFNFKILQP